MIGFLVLSSNVNNGNTNSNIIFSYKYIYIYSLEVVVVVVDVVDVFYRVRVFLFILRSHSLHVCTRICVHISDFSVNTATNFKKLLVRKDLSALPLSRKVATSR